MHHSPPSLTCHARRGLLSAALAAAALLAACGGGSEPSNTGTLRVALTDAPSCGYDAVNVTVTGVSVHRSASAGDADSGWIQIPVAARKIDLLTLQNGVLAELGQVPLAAGTYTQMRLQLAENGGAYGPLANSVVPQATGVEAALTTPSAQQTGLKTRVNITVQPDRLADFVIDFKVCDSVVQAGRSGRYLLKPVLAVSPRYISGVSGSVEAALAGAGTRISLQQAGVEFNATTPRSDGSFLIQPVPPGTYDLVITSPARATAVVTSVVVAAEAVTSVSAAGGLALAPSPQGAASGAVSTGSTPVIADVTVRQQVTPTTVVTLGRRNVDADTGGYLLTLPTAAPRVAPFVAPPAALAFAPAASAAGVYELVAASGGASKPPVMLTVLPDGTTLVPTITFP